MLEKHCYRLSITGIIQYWLSLCALSLLPFVVVFIQFKLLNQGDEDTTSVIMAILMAFLFSFGIIYYILSSPIEVCIDEDRIILISKLRTTVINVYDISYIRRLSKKPRQGIDIIVTITNVKSYTIIFRIDDVEQMISRIVDRNSRINISGFDFR